MTKFFVPSADDLDAAESRYADLAAFANCPVPDAAHRLASIRWKPQADEEWTAEVGQRLRGERRETVRDRGRQREISTPLSDGAVVLAIFPPAASGKPFTVVTDAAPLGSGRSEWVNPFIVGSHGSTRPVPFRE